MVELIPVIAGKGQFFYDAGYDNRESAQGDHPVLPAGIYRVFVSTVLQYGGYDHCRTHSQCAGFGGGRRDWRSQLSRAWFFLWPDRRFRRGDRAMFRGEGL